MNSHHSRIMPFVHCAGHPTRNRINDCWIGRIIESRSIGGETRPGPTRPGCRTNKADDVAAAFDGGSVEKWGRADSLFWNEDDLSQIDCEVHLQERNELNEDITTVYIRVSTRRSFIHSTLMDLLSWKHFSNNQQTKGRRTITKRLINISGETDYSSLP